MDLILEDSRINLSLLEEVNILFIENIDILSNVIKFLGGCSVLKKLRLQINESIFENYD